eukprot:5204844-Amphidinium_carterae.2
MAANQSKSSCRALNHDMVHHFTALSLRMYCGRVVVDGVALAVTGPTLFVQPVGKGVSHKWSAEWTVVSLGDS